jgi:hypothetical protein
MGKQDAVSGGLFGKLGVKNVSLPVHFLQVLESAHKLGEIRLLPGGVLLGCFVEKPGDRNYGQGAPEGRLCRKEVSASIRDEFQSDNAASPPSAAHFLGSSNARRIGAAGEPPRR